MKVEGLSVRHKPGIRRKIGFSGKTIQTKMRRTINFVSLGALRQGESPTASNWRNLSRNSIPVSRIVMLRKSDAQLLLEVSAHKQRLPLFPFNSESL